MSHLEPNELVVFFLGLGILLGFARILGEVARLFKQPSVVGEILAGVILGPTVLGAVFPFIEDFLFPRTGALPIVLDGISTLGVVLFLMVAGMEVDLSALWKRGRTAMSVSVTGMVVPFLVGFGAVWFATPYFAGATHPSKLVFCLFFATAMSISALPVIVKTLLDLGYYRTDLGMVVVSAAVFDDLTGWIIFAIVLSLFHGEIEKAGMAKTILLTLGYTGVMLTVGRRLIDAIIPRLQVSGPWPGGMVAFAVSGALLCAALTEWIGIHAIFGAFLFGVALGESKLMKEKTRAGTEQFVSVIFAPIFFASIGLKVNFATDFDPLLIAIVILIASTGKILGCGLAARFSGMSWRESWATGFAMNARGAMEIVLGLLALQAGIINERVFVALVVTALVTSMISGTFIEWMLGGKQDGILLALLERGGFVRPLKATDRFDSMRELAEVAAKACGVDAKKIYEETRDRELLAPTGFANGLAAPHARMEGLAEPYVIVGISEEGLDYDSEDGSPSKAIFMILTPAEDEGAQIEILSEVARFFMDEEMAAKAGEANSKNELLTLMKTKRAEAPQP